MCAAGWFPIRERPDDMNKNRNADFLAAQIFIILTLLLIVAPAGAQVCSCGHPCDLELSSETIFSSETHSACLSVIAGPIFHMEDTANVNLRSGDYITLDAGVEVDAGATLVLTIDPALYCDESIDLDSDTWNGCLDCDDETASINPDATEKCNGKDDNCDGNVDEGNPEGGGTCGSDVGTCVSGHEECTDGELICVGAVGPAEEVCDGLDNDCDGEVDEGFAYCINGGPAPNTDGKTCDPGWIDANGDPEDGCETPA